MKNPDAIVDGKLAEFKQVDSSDINRFSKRIIECDKQKAEVACIKINKIDLKEAINFAYQMQGLENIKEIWIIFENKIAKIKKTGSLR